MKGTVGQAEGRFLKRYIFRECFKAPNDLLNYNPESEATDERSDPFFAMGLCNAERRIAIIIRTTKSLPKPSSPSSLHVWPDILAAWQIDLKRYGFRFRKGASLSLPLNLTRDMFSKVAIDNEVEFTSVLLPLRLCRRRIRLMGYQ